MKKQRFLPEHIFNKMKEAAGKHRIVYFMHFKDEKPDEQCNRLSAYCDLSAAVFMCINDSMNFKTSLNDAIKGLVDRLIEDCRGKYNKEIKDYDYDFKTYTFYDDANIKVEYHREKLKNGIEVDYMRLIISISCKVE